VAAVQSGVWVATQLFLRKLVDICAPGRSSGLPFINHLPNALRISGFRLILHLNEYKRLTATGIAPVLHRTSLLITQKREPFAVQKWGINQQAKIYFADKLKNINFIIAISGGIRIKNAYRH